MERSLCEALTEALEATPWVLVAVLFGSEARAATHADSDIDIGVLPRGEPQLSEELALQAALEKRSGRAVDLVRLDSASPMLRFRAAREGVVLVSRRDEDAVRFRARAAIDHADFAPRFERAAELYRRRLARGRGARS